MSEYFQESQAIIGVDELETSLEEDFFNEEMLDSSPVSSKRKSLKNKDITRAPKKIKVKK